MTGLVDAATPYRVTIDLPEGALAGWRWKNTNKPPLLFLHANGFCAFAYRQMLGHLAGDFDITALDLRGHGRTRLPADPAHLRSWRPYVDDIGAFLDLQKRTGWTLAGHSLGAATALIAAKGRRDISALTLIEPVAIPGWISALAKTSVWPVLAKWTPLARSASHRRNGWPDRAAAAVAYESKAFFRAWAPGVLEDYLFDGVEEQAEGARLACDPAWEAATFSAQANDFWKVAFSAPAPVRVFAADHPTSTLSCGARQRFQRLGAVLTVKSAVTHLAPMENPAFLAAFLAGSADPEEKMQT